MAAKAYAEAAEAAFRRGDLVEAERWGERALASDPGCTLANLVLGVVGAAQGRPEALDRLRRVLAAEPEHPDALNGLAALALRGGRPDEAEGFARRAVAARPDDPEGHNHLGLAHLRRRQAPEAVAAFEAALRCGSDQANLHHNLGQAHLVAGEDEAAARAFRAALALEPHEPRSVLALVNVLLNHALVEEPTALLRAASARHPGSAALHLALARALAAARDRAGARAAYLRAVALDPNAEVGFAFWLQEEGAFDEAATRLRRSVEARPRQGQAYYGLLQGRKASEDDRPLMARMAAISGEGGLNSRETAYLHYALGKAHDDLREYETALRHFDRANEAAWRVHLAARPFDPEALRAETDRTIRTLDREAIRRLTQTAATADRPIFIVGMIRSGTSLLEQIVGSHPKVAPAGELRFWLEEAPSALERGLDVPSVRDLRDRYDAYLRALAPGSPHVTDKMPLNYAYVGLFAAAFPRAPILHIRRHPVDTCLSIYTTPYASPPDWAYVRENVVANYREYQRLMAHWRAVLPPGRMLEIDYESLVDDREATIRRAIEFCGLPWDDACLRPERSRQTVGTPSLWQVRQPIYRTSVERWRNYAPWLGAFGELLEGAPT